MKATDLPAVPYDLGHGVQIVRWGTNAEGDVIGLEETHPRNDDGKPCSGYVVLDVPENPNRQHPMWTVESWAPLTLSPSLLCRACQNHGFIRGGQWVPA